MKALIWVLILVGFVSCVGIRYDATSLTNVQQVATALPALMGKATKSFKDSEAEVTKLTGLLDQAQKHAAGLKKNQDVAEQWRILRDELVNPFVANWKEKGKLDKDFVTAATQQVTGALSAIERAERAKRGAPKR
jgi:hypothetical protein